MEIRRRSDAALPYQQGAPRLFRCISGDKALADEQNRPLPWMAWSADLECAVLFSWKRTFAILPSTVNRGTPSHIATAPRPFAMSGLELLGALLGLYPIIVDLANTYKEMKGTGSAELSRDIMVAETVYNQTCIGILQSAVSPEELRRLAPGQGRGTIDQTLWAAPEIQEKLLARLGPSRSALTLELLTNMCSLLEQVNTELTNMCRGTVRVSWRHWNSA
jgi:hypothetical protein